MMLPMWKQLQHAFALTPDEPPSDEELAVAADFARGIIRRELVLPAQMFLEMSRPLNGLASQAMAFLMPIATTLFDQKRYETFARFLERRESVDILCRMLNVDETIEPPGDAGSSAP